MGIWSTRICSPTNSTEMEIRSIGIYTEIRWTGVCSNAAYGARWPDAAGGRMEIRLGISKIHYCYAIKNCLDYYSPTTTYGLWVCNTHLGGALNLNYYALMECLAPLYHYTSCRFPDQSDVATKGTIKCYTNTCHFTYRYCCCEPFPKPLPLVCCYPVFSLLASPSSPYTIN